MSKPITYSGSTEHHLREMKKMLARTNEPDLVDLINSAMFHYWNCGMGCDEARKSMAKLAVAIQYDSGVDALNQDIEDIANETH